MQALNREELTKFLIACEQQGEQYRLMAIMAVRHGLRVSELTGRWAVRKVKKQKERYFHRGILAREVREGFITIRRLKGSLTTKQRLEPHDNPLLDEKAALEKLALITPPNEQLFKMDRTTVWRHLKLAGKAAGVRMTAAHIRGMKHTLGTLAAEKTSVKKLQMQMGHRNPKSTMAYYDVTPEQAAETVSAALDL